MSEKQKLAREKNWNLFVLKGILANLSNTRYRMARRGPNWPGLYSVSQAQHYVMQALEDIKETKNAS